MSKNARLSVESLAALCLGHLAQDPEQLAEFLHITGYTPATLRAALDSAQLRSGLLDYFAGNEPLLLAVCANNGVEPEAFMRVWAQLNPAG